MPSLCEKMYRCKQCNKIFDRHKRDISSHKCGEYYCTCCNTYVTDEHLCYFKIKPLKVTSGRFLYYDFETCQDSLITCDHGYKNKPRQNCQSCTPVQLCSQCRRCINCKKSYCGLEQHVRGETDGLRTHVPIASLLNPLPTCPSDI